MLLDKDILDPAGFSSSETKKSDPGKSESCDYGCFNNFYEKLTQRKNQKVNKPLLLKNDLFMSAVKLQNKLSFSILKLYPGVPEQR